MRFVLPANYSPRVQKPKQKELLLVRRDYAFTRPLRHYPSEDTGLQSSVLLSSRAAAVKLLLVSLPDAVSDGSKSILAPFGKLSSTEIEDDRNRSDPD